MIVKRSSTISFLFFFSLIAISACDSGPADQAISNDDQLTLQVEAALASTTDVPRGLIIEVSQGHAHVSGSLSCEGCGGMRTPGTIDTIQQSLGAIVRAVPGITGVEFSLASDNTP